MSVVLPPPAPPSAPLPPQSGKQARAEAKAASARAKALRPWYRKKRFILGIPLVVIVVIMIAASAGKSSKSASTNSPTPTVAKGIGSADASGDVSGAVLGQPDTIGFRAVTLTVTNHSSKRSNYIIEMAIESPDGKTQYDTSMAAVNNLEPGQTTTPAAFPITKTVPSDAVVNVKTVTRLASN